MNLKRASTSASSHSRAISVQGVDYCVQNAIYMNQSANCRNLLLGLHNISPHQVELWIEIIISLKLEIFQKTQVITDDLCKHDS